jgi:four helix bundle protein
MTNEQTPVGGGGPWGSEEPEDAVDYPEWETAPAQLREGNEAALSDGRHPNLPFDLEERTARFGEAIVRFAKKLPQNPANNRIIDQLVGCGTSVGGNYCEADEAVSKKEFINKIGTCKKEAKETKFFLRMAATAELGLKAEARELWHEAKELHLIFSKIFRSSRGKTR